MLDIGTKQDNTPGLVGELKANEWNSSYLEAKSVILASGQTLSGADSNQLLKGIVKFAYKTELDTTGSTANNIKLSTGGGSDASLILEPGMKFDFTPTANNTGPTVVDVFGQTGIPLQKKGNPLAANDLVLGRSISIVYKTGNVFEMVDGAASIMDDPNYQQMLTNNKPNSSIRMGSNGATDWDGITFDDATDTFRFLTDQPEDGTGGTNPLLEISRSVFKWNGKTVLTKNGADSLYHPLKGDFAQPLKGLDYSAGTVNDYIKISRTGIGGFLGGTPLINNITFDKVNDVISYKEKELTINGYNEVANKAVGVNGAVWEFKGERNTRNGNIYNGFFFDNNRSMSGTQLNIHGRQDLVNGINSAANLYFKQNTTSVNTTNGYIHGMSNLGEHANITAKYLKGYYGIQTISGGDITEYQSIYTRSLVEADTTVGHLNGVTTSLAHKGTTTDIYANKNLIEVSGGGTVTGKVSGLHADIKYLTGKGAGSIIGTSTYIELGTHSAHESTSVTGTNTTITVKDGVKPTNVYAAKVYYDDTQSVAGQSAPDNVYLHYLSTSYPVKTGSIWGIYSNVTFGNFFNGYTVFASEPTRGISTNGAAARIQSNNGSLFTYNRYGSGSGARANSSVLANNVLSLSANDDYKDMGGGVTSKRILSIKVGDDGKGCSILPYTQASAGSSLVAKSGFSYSWSTNIWTLTGTLNSYVLNTNSGGVGTISDERDKTNITPLTTSTSKILDINPVEFDWDIRDNDDKSHDGMGRTAGFIAQELLEVFKDEEPLMSNKIVNVDNEEQYTVNHTALIPLMVKMLQEQDKRIAALEKHLGVNND